VTPIERAVRPVTADELASVPELPELPGLDALDADAA
jgi:hypothetical protein